MIHTLNITYIVIVQRSMIMFPLMTQHISLIQQRVFKILAHSKVS